MAAHQPTRVRERPAGDEEATSNLRLGEFQDVPSLTLSEARVLIDAVMNHRKTKNGGVKEGDVYTKTVDYLDIFARFKAKENVNAVERLLGTRTELSYFERSQLGCLCCNDADEAKTLIPSLANKITDADLQLLLEDITRLRVADQ